MAVALSRPSGRRSEDIRALRFRFRTLTFSGTYAQATGEALTARQFGLVRILGVIPLSPLIMDPAGFTGVMPVFTVSADGRTVRITALEDAAGAAGTPFGQQKTDAEAYVANSAINVVVIGE
jgi:hypothetical protein